MELREYHTQENLEIVTGDLVERRATELLHTPKRKHLEECKLMDSNFEILENQSTKSMFECQLCAEEFKTEVLFCSKCGISYCKKCWDEWIKNGKCPNCRQDVTKEKLVKNLLVSNILEKKERQEFIKCEEHEECTKMHCYTCSKNICSQCIFTGEHSLHKIMSHNPRFINSLEAFKKLDSDLMKIMKKVIYPIKESMEEIDDFDYFLFEKFLSEFSDIRSGLKKHEKRHRENYERFCDGMNRLNREMKHCSHLKNKIQSIVCEVSQFKTPEEGLAKINEVTHEMESDFGKYKFYALDLYQAKGKGGKTLKDLAKAWRVKEEELSQKGYFEVDRDILIGLYFEDSRYLRNVEDSLLDYSKEKIEAKAEEIRQQRSQIKQDNIKKLQENEPNLEFQGYSSSSESETDRSEGGEEDNE